MLIQLKTVPSVMSFEELYQHTLKLLGEIPHERKTMVLGPVTAPDTGTMDENLSLLSFYSKRLSEKGWAVLDLHSFQPVIDQIIAAQGIQGYPYGILIDFTLPLIRTGQFKPIHFREDFHVSLGATLEHDVALGVGVPVRYLP